MEKPVPMDRLICGDVGYGKTEIAVRAAFKAVQDGKQVAVLVPTTLLVQQHLETFAERYAEFPVKVQALSRFQTDKEAKEVVDGLARRHGRRRHRHAPAPHRRGPVQGPRPGRRRRGAALRRRAQGDAQAAAHQRRRARDVRDADPAHAGDGGHRHPRDVDARHAAGGAPPGADVRRARTTRSRSPPRSGASCCARARSSTSTTGSSRSSAAAARLRELVPEARIAIAHGQMSEHQLEQVIVDFWEKQFDVLVCTTIVETGLDISNANTLIVERADMLGPVAAAPAARPGRPRPRAGVRVLPVPAGEAADRDRARPARDDRRAHRPRRRACRSR